MNSLRIGKYLKSRVQSPTSNQTVTKKLLCYTFITVVIWCSLPHNTTQCFNNCQVAVTSRFEVIVTKGMSANQYCNYCSTATSLPSATPGYEATLLQHRTNTEPRTMVCHTPGHLQEVSCSLGMHGADLEIEEGRDIHIEWGLV